MKKINIRAHARLIKNLVVLCLSLGILLAGVGIIWVSTLKMPSLEAFEQRKIEQSTKIFDRTGEVLLYDVHENAKRTVVPFNEISRHIKNATVAIEDTEFYDHWGVKPKAFLRAVLVNITEGEFSQGGSTITQQVVKNALLTTDKRITRKIKEWVLAVKLEKTISKEDILGIYLNESPYGGSLYGVEEATRAFFNKSSNDVTLAEAAYIAALPQAPTYYSPYGNHVDDLTKRKNLVLRRMLESDFITKEEYDEAIKEQVKFMERAKTGIKAPHFALMVKEYLVEKYGEDVVERDGLKVITSLDYSLQEKAEKVIDTYSPTLDKNFKATNTGLVAIDPKTGDILAMIGSRNYFDTKIQGNFNIATAQRQPGSSFKPIVYATAFNEGYTPETVLFDVKTEFSSECTPEGKPKNPNSDTKCYSPVNYDGKFEGPMTIKKALAESRNIPAVKALYLTGIRDAIRTAQDLGIESLNDPDRYGLTLVLGGGEVSLLNLTGAYGVFANDGIRNPHRLVLKVTDSKGNTLEENQPNPTRVLPENTARQISDILSDEKVRIPSIRDLLAPLNRDIAVKTGTTNDYRDVWTLGYTPQLAVGIWAGNNDNSPLDRSTTAGLIITPVWAAFMQEAVKDMPEERFRRPDPIPTDLKPALRGYWQGSQSYYMDAASGGLATEHTPEELKREVIANSVHSILHWVDKDDPRGPIPNNPSRDSQYELWEHGVREWFRGYQQQTGFQESTNFTIPDEVDTVHAPELAPQVTITSPNNRATFDENEVISVTLKTNTVTSYPISKAEYFINDKYIGTAHTSPFGFSFIPSDIDKIENENELRVVVYDSVLNKGEAKVRFNVR